MRISKAIWWSAFLLAAMTGPSCLAQDIQNDFVLSLQPEYGTARLFPSLLPVTFLKVSYFAYRQSTPQDPNPNEELAFPPTSTAPGETPWILIRKGADDPESGTDILNQVEQIDLQSFPGIAYFYFKPGALRQGDHLQVALLTRSKPSGIVRRKFHSSDSATAEELEVPVKQPSSYTLNLDPRTVADQELLDGTSKTVHQLGLDLDIPSFGSRRLGNLYFHTENVLSTDGDDTSAKADLRFGLERSLLRAWYVPANLEARYVTNQALTNRSFLLSGGFRTFIPWGFGHRFERRPQKGKAVVQSEKDLEVIHHTGWLWNNLVKSPLAPELNLSLQYEDRLELDPTTSDVHAAEKVGRVETRFELNPIYLLASETPTPNDIVLSIRAKGWWFLNEESLPGASARNLEGNLETDISIPLTRFKVTNLLGSSNAEDPTEKKFQIRYRAGANEANSFVRSSEWSIGFNILR